jgi:hypothetical protein
MATTLSAWLRTARMLVLPPSARWPQPAPTVQQLVGDAAFGVIARALWQAHPPLAGDLAEWGGALPDWLAADPALADEPHLADVARVDLALHRAESAADVHVRPSLPAAPGRVRPGRAAPSVAGRCRPPMNVAASARRCRLTLTLGYRRPPCQDFPLRPPSTAARCGVLGAPRAGLRPARPPRGSRKVAKHA